MIRRPEEMGAYTFAVLAGLRAAQLMRGCVPRVESGSHKAIIVAQLEIAAGTVGEAGEPSALQDDDGTHGAGTESQDAAETS